MRSLIARRRQALILAAEEKLRLAEAQGDNAVAAGLFADLAELHRERVNDVGRREHGLLPNRR